MIFRKFKYNRFLLTINAALHVVTIIDLAKSSLIELLGNDVSVVENEALEFLYDRDGPMLCAALLKDVMNFVFRVHLFRALFLDL